MIFFRFIQINKYMVVIVLPNCINTPSPNCRASCGFSAIVCRKILLSPGHLPSHPTGSVDVPRTSAYAEEKLRNTKFISRYCRIKVLSTIAEH